MEKAVGCVEIWLRFLSIVFVLLQCVGYCVPVLPLWLWGYLIDQLPCVWDTYFLDTFGYLRANHFWILLDTFGYSVFGYCLIILDTLVWLLDTFWILLDIYFWIFWIFVFWHFGYFLDTIVPSKQPPNIFLYFWIFFKILLDTYLKNVDESEKKN